MKFKYVNYDVISETDIIEKGEDVVSTLLNVNFIVEDDNSGVIPPLSQQLIVLNNNNQTGFQMDEQREKESITFVEKLNQ